MIFRLTPNQEIQAQKFRELHSENCPKISKEKREFVETEEQATVCSSYKYSFVNMGICNHVEISCCLCEETSVLEMSQEELDNV